MKTVQSGHQNVLLLFIAVLLATACALIYGPRLQLGGFSSGSRWQPRDDGQNSPLTDLPNRFYGAAAALRNAKVTPPGHDGYYSHHYQTIYDKYLGFVSKDAPLRILEIGLGCGMPQEWGGTGNSLKLWRALFPRAAVTFIEYRADCAEEFRADIEATGGKLFTGSQADPKVLSAVVAWASRIGGFDMIIDDGGHNPVHQRQSLEGLWPALRPGGVYVVEDLLTSYWERYNTTGSAEGAFIPFMKDAIDAMNCHGALPELTANRWREHCKQPLLGKQFLAVECGAEICAVLKHRTPPPAGYTF